MITPVLGFKEYEQTKSQIVRPSPFFNKIKRIICWKYSQVPTVSFILNDSHKVYKDSINIIQMKAKFEYE